MKNPFFRITPFLLCILLLMSALISCDVSKPSAGNDDSSTKDTSDTAESVSVAESSSEPPEESVGDESSEAEESDVDYVVLPTQAQMDADPERYIGDDYWSLWDSLVIDAYITYVVRNNIYVFPEFPDDVFSDFCHEYNVSDAYADVKIYKIEKENFVAWYNEQVESMAGTKVSKDKINITFWLRRYVTTEYIDALFGDDLEAFREACGSAYGFRCNGDYYPCHMMLEGVCVSPKLTYKNIMSETYDRNGTRIQVYDFKGNKAEVYLEPIAIYLLKNKLTTKEELITYYRYIIERYKLYPEQFEPWSSGCDFERTIETFIANFDYC